MRCDAIPTLLRAYGRERAGQHGLERGVGHARRRAQALDAQGLERVPDAHEDESTVPPHTHAPSFLSKYIFEHTYADVPDS